MTFAVGRASAFTEVKMHSEARVKEAKEKLDGDLEALIKSSQESIQKLEIEIGVLQGRITLLEKTLNKERSTHQAALSALRLEVGIEKEKRVQAERERDVLLEVFKRGRPETDHIDEELRWVYSPGTFDCANRAVKCQAAV